MADDADLAAAIVDDLVAAGIAAARAPIAAGVAGECENCGEDMPRLVEGRCGFCRDGRRRERRFDHLPPLPPGDDDDEPIPAARPRPVEEPAIMPAPLLPTKRVISLPAEGAVLAAIEARAAEDEISLGRAALELIEHGVDALSRAPDAPDAPELPPHPAPLALEHIHLDALLGEVKRRFDHAGDKSAELAAIGRADEAEAALARVKAAIGG